MNKLTKSITMGAAATAIFVALYGIFGITDETIQELMGVLAVMPVAIYTHKYGIKSGLICMGACILLSLFLVQPTIYVTYAIPAAIIGTVLGAICHIDKPIRIIVIISVLNILHLAYELVVASFFTKIDIITQYTKLVNEFTVLISGGKTDTVLYHLGKDMAVGIVPMLFALVAAAKAAMSYLLVIIALNRIFKENIKIKIKSQGINEKLIAIIYLSLFAITVLSLILALSGIIPYHFWIAILCDIMFIVMYLYFIHGIRQFAPVIRCQRNILLPVLVTLIFPVTNIAFAIFFIKGNTELLNE